MGQEVKQPKTKLQFQVVDAKKDPLISASASLALNLVTLNINNEQVNDKLHAKDNKKENKRGSTFQEENIGRIWRF